MKKLQIVNLIILVIIKISYSQSIVEWRGENRTGIYKETNLLKEWPENGPELLWYNDSIYKGYSSASVSEKISYITGISDSMDVLFALDHLGKQLWETHYGRAWDGTFTHSRATPTIEGSRIYISSGKGDIACLDKNTGKIIWVKKASEHFAGTFGDWGISESLLLVDNKVIFSPGGSKTTVIALNKLTGNTLWKSESLNDTPAYVSPLLVNYQNKKLIITVLSKYLIVVDSENGEILSKYDYAGISNKVALELWEGAPFTNTNTPVFRDGYIYVTSGYDHVGVKFKLSNDLKTISQEWIDTTLDVHHGGVVLLGNYLYGSNWISNINGNWCCIDWETGKTSYEKEWFTKGSIIYADERFYCYDEKRGNIALVEANPKEFKIKGTFKVPYGRGPHWSHLTIDDGILYVRHENAIMAYDIRGK
ncbi:MAG: PQQ-binding-like beta-propeller repeat protein [Bacteroidetes bacterium]|jgi:outer membrane protein assembly factor BamB|nr:PQQ-binding-like beta-propeller repeat protein [Bacteroidota bacterium]MBT6686527.1 PQQ-binding-like beta-propeller repeat protein [Bacteroidota bacterium]MBT7141752.1 PQQ-binding-like beta-propeller repeat protein [Bacteroidota bacterium]MBT7493459.1 PQQ-binding-like beta-propeller repeat protein [Bacteroidota bacterium]